MAKNKQSGYLIGAGILVIIVVGVFAAFNAKQIMENLGLSTKAPAFSFNQSAAPGWWNTANYNAQATADGGYKGSEPIEKLPVASMNIFKGVKGDGVTACFVMYSYYDYPADAGTLREKHKPSGLADTTVQELGDTELSMNTPDGAKSYALHSYALSGPGSANTMKGTSFGLIDLGNSYITVSGVCPTGADLVDTISATSAVSLTK